MNTTSTTVFKFRVGRTGASMAHMEYISRQTAVLDEEIGVLMRNIPELVQEARNYRELRENLACYAWAREKSEIARYKGKGEVRTHYRVMASFEKNVDVEKIKQMMNEWLENKLPTARACGFIHRDTDHVHVHIWVDARQISGEKIHFGSKSYKSLDKEWNRIYSKEMDRPERDYLDRIENNRQERAFGKQLKSENQKLEKQVTRKSYDDKEKNLLGVKESDKERARGNQPSITNSAERDNQGKSATQTKTAQLANARAEEQVSARNKGLERSNQTTSEATQPNEQQNSSDSATERETRTRLQAVSATNREVEAAVQELERTVQKWNQLDSECDRLVKERELEQEREPEYDQNYDDRDDYDEPSR